MLDLNPTLSIITLTVYELNTLKGRDCLNGLKSKTQLYIAYEVCTWNVKLQEAKRKKDGKQRKESWHGCINIGLKRLQDKEHYWGEEEYFIMIKEAVHQEDVIINVYIPAKGL